MTNRVRTLLLNRERAGTPPGFPAEEYVPPTFRQRTLSGPLQRAWHFLFGTNPDRLFLNYRLRQLMTLLHTSELGSLVPVPDSRITYWPFDASLFAAPASVTITRENGSTADPHVNGTQLCDEGAGQAQRLWRITALGTEQVQIRDLRSRDVSTAAFAYTNGLSDAVPIPKSALSLRFRVLTAGDRWAVTTQAPPRTDIGEVLAGLEIILGQEAIATLFAASAPVLLRVWQDHPITTNRYAALLLAMADAIERSPVQE